MTTYASLTAAQQAHAAYLFADQRTGNDSTQYEYELNGETVVGRSRIAHDGDASAKRKPHTVTVNVAVREVPDGFITLEMNRYSELTIQDFARKIVERVKQSQPVEA